MTMVEQKVDGQIHDTIQSLTAKFDEIKFVMQQEDKEEGAMNGSLEQRWCKEAIKLVIQNLSEQ